MPKSRAPWWMYVLSAVFALTFLFNARQEALGPANTGWIPSWPLSRVAGVTPGRPMEKAGLRAGDVLKEANGLPITGMPDWFVARAHFERGIPIALKIQREKQDLSLEVLITAPAWRTWEPAHLIGESVFYCARLILLSLAILVAFSRPERFRARLAALMLAVGAVAEGYPSSGWAAALRHLPAVLAIPICLATTSCLLAPLIWLPFFASLHRPWPSTRRQSALLLVPGAIFGIPMIASTIAMIYAPWILARPWAQVLSAAPVRLIQDIAGVSPLLFLNVLPVYRPIAQVMLLTLWLTMTVVYFAAGFLLLADRYRKLDNASERRRVGLVCFVVVIFGIVVAHNILTRNWTDWFVGSRPAFLSSTASVVADVSFLIVPLVLAHFVLSETDMVERPDQSAETDNSN